MTNRWENVNEEIKVKPIKLSQIEDIRLTARQQNLVVNLVREITIAINTIEIENNEKWNHDVFSRSLIWLEREASSIIEGSLTSFEEQNNDHIYSIHDAYTWQDRNLYNLYLKYLDINTTRPTIFNWNKWNVSNLHKELYDDLSLNDNFKMEYDPTEIIKKVNPGVINSNDESGSSFGEEGRPKKLHFIQPSKKEGLLEDLMNSLDKKINDNTLEISDIAKFHVIFEGIHPFNDGNGRIGRLMLAMLFKKWGPISDLPNFINLSEYFEENKKEYLRLLRLVQLDPNDKSKWYQWNSFFIGAVLDSKKKQIQRLQIINKLYQDAANHRLIKNNSIRKKILFDFFKYYKLKKSNVIEKFKTQKSSKALYNDFQIVVDIIEAKVGQDGVYEFYKLSQALRNV